MTSPVAPPSSLAPGASAVELRAAWKSFGSVEALRGVDLVVPTSGLTTVVGPSGCGKTTTLRLLAGFESPDSGEVWVGGRPVASGACWVPPERRGVGIVFQQLALFPHLDVAANVGYGLARLDRRARRARVGELLTLVSLAGYERRYPDQLSGGQAQRVALARALAPKPSVVLLDEPFSNLDVSLRADLRAEVRSVLQAEGAAAVLVTHDQDEALSFADQVAVMFDGTIAQVGRPEEVYRQPTTEAVAAFLGDANLVPGVVRAGVIDTELGAVPVGVADGPAVVLLRPEDLEVVEAAHGPGRVVHAEYHGHDRLVSVALPSGTRVRVRVAAGQQLSGGEAVVLRARTGRAVAYPRPLGAAAAPSGPPR